MSTATRRRESTEEGSAGAAGAASREDGLDDLTSELRTIGRELVVQLRVAVDRIESSAGRKLHTGVVLAAAAVALATAVATGSWLLARGFAGWIGDLVAGTQSGAELAGGAALLAAIAAGFALRWRLHDARRLRKARARYEGREAA